MKGDSRRLFATAIPAVTLLVLFAFVFYLGQVQADCSIWDMEVNQTLNGWLRGIPVYQVVVLNLCNIPDGCLLGDIHLTCGDFSTSLPVDPLTFRLINFNDCLLVDGGNTYSGNVISFKYAHPGPYPMTISSVTCFPQIPPT
ncbi:TPD1 protein homolog 1B-like [Zingiber officinale]|uniref:TPD1 protein homolog 1B-like n=1 Tax=Zingiber officinale TaxID=94328 RepID=UPI001C4D8A3F|nr:TPD1 protein homolog 1B-like [Zingiber officinale]